MQPKSSKPKARYEEASEKSNFNERKYYINALHDWVVRIHRLNRDLGHRLYIPTGYYNLMDHDEARREGWDLADVVMS